MSMLRPYIGPEEIQTIETLEHALHCPRCTQSLSSGGFASAYWHSEAIVYFCWCGSCNWVGDISEFSVFTNFEAIESEDGGDPPHLELIANKPT